MRRKDALWITCGLGTFFLATASYHVGHLRGEMEASRSNLRAAGFVLQVIAEKPPDGPMADLPSSVETPVAGNAFWIERVLDRFWWLAASDPKVVRAEIEAARRSLDAYRNWKGLGPAEYLSFESKEELIERIDQEIDKAEQASSGQPATRSEPKPEGDDKPQPEAEGRSR
jgi:hypothetical protein